jgi:hypothetical protein
VTARASRTSSWIGPPAPRPCASCPYRRDVPSGVWAREEYAKLPRYDEPTQQQPTGVFLCHQTDRDADGRRVCAGWAGCHDGNHLLALRVAAASGSMTVEAIDATIGYVSPVPLFASGAEAAEHGMAEITEPGPRAAVSMAKIARRRRDLLTDREEAV